MENFKYSKYNSILNISNNLSVLYNSKEDKCIVFKKEKEDLLTKTPSELINLDSNLFNDLKNINGIVDINKNELEEVIKKSKEIDNDDTHFKLIINPTMSCNFSCWYCYESHILGSQISNRTLDKIYKLIDNIFISNRNLKSFIISFFGGEPLMYYNKTTKNVIDYLRSQYDSHKNIDFSINFTSNAYLLNDKIITHLVEGKESNHFQITLDGGREEHNKVRDSGKSEGSYDKIIDSIKKLVQNKIEVLVRINYTSENIDSTKEIIDDLKDIPEEFKEFLKIGYFRVWQDDKSINLDKEVKEINSVYQDSNFRVSQDEFILDDLINSCYADKKNELVVNFNGDIYKCTARDFSQENKYGKLNDNGEIDWIKEKLDEWENIKIQSKACQNCRILPLCGGGCHQINLESKGLDICQMGFSNAKKDEIILTRLSEFFVNEE